MNNEKREFMRFDAPAGMPILHLDVEVPRGVGTLDFDFDVFVSSRQLVRIAPKQVRRPKRRSKGGRTTGNPSIASVFCWMPIDRKGGTA